MCHPDLCPRHHNQLYFLPRPALPPIPSGKDKHPHDSVFPGHCQPQPPPKLRRKRPKDKRTQYQGHPSGPCHRKLCLAQNGGTYGTILGPLEPPGHTPSRWPQAYTPGNADPGVQIVELGGAQRHLLVLLLFCGLHAQSGQLFFQLQQPPLLLQQTVGEREAYSCC